MLDKISILEGEWIDRTWLSEAGDIDLLSRLSKAGFSIQQEHTLPLTRLHDDNFWGSLRSVHRIFMARIDHRHWYFDDEVFHDYVRKVSNIRFPAVALGDSPYGHEYPRQVGLDAFEKKLFERTKILADAIKNKHPDTLIVSPHICVVDYNLRERYLDYFVHNRKHFDVYGLNCCFDMREQSVAVLTALLNEVLYILKKDVWVTRWSVPACNEKIQNPNVMAAPSWRPMFVEEAAIQLKNIYEAVENITGGRSKWFFSGCSKDEYHPSKKVPESLWLTDPHMRVASTPMWNFSHFTGLVDYHNKVKEPILQSLMNLHENPK